MSLEAKIDNLTKEFKSLKSLLIKQQDEWISEVEAAKFLGMSARTLKQLRADGKIEHWRKRTTGRGIQYLKSSLEKLFITTSK